MSRKCPECLESGSRSHLPDCSYAPNTAEREAFIREHAVELVRSLEAKVRRQAEQLTANAHTIRILKRDLKAAAERIAGQSEILSRRA
jgi:hypothetical protein